MEVREFTRRHLPALEKQEARFNLMLSILARAVKDPGKARLWSFGEGTACAVQTPPHFLVLGDLDEEAAGKLAEEVAGLDFLGCLGSQESCAPFVKALRERGVELVLDMPQRIHLLSSPPVYPKCDGRGRAAGPPDEDLFCDLFFRFCREALPGEVPQSDESVRRNFRERAVFFWESQGAVVAMAAHTRQTPNGTNISWVYTPPEKRGLGYAGAATAFACEEAFRLGKKLLFLYTDLRNPASNRVYKKIGFEPLADSVTYKRVEKKP